MQPLAPGEPPEEGNYQNKSASAAGKQHALTLSSAPLCSAHFRQSTSYIYPVLLSFAGDAGPLGTLTC